MVNCGVSKTATGGINHYFLCDRGRFGYGYVNLPERPYKTYHRHENQLFELSTTGRRESSWCVASYQTYRRHRFTSAPASKVTSPYVNWLAKNITPAVSPKRMAMSCKNDRVTAPCGVNTPRCVKSKLRCHFVLGEDLTQTAARMALAVRQAVKPKPARKLPTEFWQVRCLADRFPFIQNIGQNDRFPLSDQLTGQHAFRWCRLCASRRLCWSSSRFCRHAFTG